MIGFFINRLFYYFDVGLTSTQRDTVPAIFYSIVYVRYDLCSALSSPYNLLPLWGLRRQRKEGRCISVFFVFEFLLVQSITKRSRYPAQKKWKKEYLYSSKRADGTYHQVPNIKKCIFINLLGQKHLHTGQNIYIAKENEFNL